MGCPVENWAAAGERDLQPKESPAEAGGH